MSLAHAMRVLVLNLGLNKNCQCVTSCTLTVTVDNNQSHFKYTKVKILMTRMGGTMGRKIGYTYKHTYFDIVTYTFKCKETYKCKWQNIQNTITTPAHV